MIDELQDTRRNREPKPFASAALLMMNVFRPTISPPTSTSGPPLLPRVDGRVGLQVHHRIIGIRLPPCRTDDAHGDRVLQTIRAPDRDD